MAWFERTTFKSAAMFDDATFDDTWFRVTKFEGSSTFRKATFGNLAWFGWTTFEGDAWFHEATFKGTTVFDAATFKNDARFDKTTFKKGVRFVKASFEGDASTLGPLIVQGTLNLDGARFASPTQIETVASAFDCREARFLAGVRFDIRRAVIRLDESDFSAPSLLTGSSGSDAAEHG
jgi:hypothetical protein